MKNFRISFLGLFLFSASLLGLAAEANAQITYIGTTNGTTQWTNSAIWSGGSVPNAVDAVVNFTNVATNTGVVWSNTNFTVGTLNFSNSSGSVVIGDNAITNDTLTLGTSTGKPVFNVATNNGTAFIYATLLGTNGFTKTGAGNFTFRFNTTPMTYTGNINLNAGTLTYNQDSSLGDANNDIIVGGNSTLSYSPGSNTGAGVLAADRSISISNGVTLSLQTLNTNSPLTVNGVISDAGALTFVGTGTGSNAASSLSYTLNGQNTYAGQTTIQGGSRVTLGYGASMGSGALSLSGGSGLGWTLDLGGNSQNVSSLTAASSLASVRTISIGNGTLNVTNASGAFSFNGTNGTLLNMSNLTTFTWGGLTNRNFTIQPDTSINATVANTNIVYFARSSNQITGLTVTIGAALGAGQGLDHAARVFLGTNNVINASSLNIGGFNGVGSVDFMGNVVGGSVKLRNTNGTDALPLLVVGNTSSGQRRGSGTLDLGVADALVTDTIVGNFQANSIANLTVTSSITMAGGSFNSASLYLGSMTNPAGSGNTLTNISNFQQNGGTSSVTLLRMGDNRATNNIGNTIAFQSTYNLLGSTALLRAQTIDAGTNANFGANSFHTLTMSNDATLRNASGVDLTVNGFTNTPAGLVNINLAGNGTVGADVDRKVIFGDKTLVSGPGALTKTGAGTLVLSGSNTYSGATTVSDGTLMVVRTNLTATITSSNISVVFSNTNSGTFPVLSGPLGGTYTGTVASTGLNTNQTATFDTTNGTVTVAAAKQAQTITGLASTDTKTYGASAYTLSVTKGASSSPLTFESSNTGVATVSTTGEVTIFGAGSTTIRVNQAGDENYMAATEVTQVLTVAKATPSITANPTASAIIAGNALSSSTLSGGTASVGGGFAWTSPSTVPSSTGSFSVTFTPADSANYNTTTSNVSVIVNSAGPTFDGAYPGKNLGDVAPNGLTYLMNYAFGGSDTTKPKLPVQDTADSTKLALVAYVRTGDTSLSVGGQAAASLDFSSPSSATYEVITPSDAPAGMEKRRYSVGVSGDRQFLRLIVTKQ